MLKKVNIAEIKEEAEALYKNGGYYCSEAVIAVIRKNIVPDMPVEVIAAGSGFPVGIGGSKCACGALTGGVIVLGYLFGRTAPGDDKVKKAMALSKELHDSFQKNHKVLCCKLLTKGMEPGSPERMKKCVSFTGEIAAKTAELIARELHIKI
jgi:C_GCAxxG_C_C family probable redox protein